MAELLSKSARKLAVGGSEGCVAAVAATSAVADGDFAGVAIVDEVFNGLPGRGVGRGFSAEAVAALAGAKTLRCASSVKFTTDCLSAA